MQCSSNDIFENIHNNKPSTANNILEIIKVKTQDEFPCVIETEEKYLKAKDKILKQLPIIYKNTRMLKFCIESCPTLQKIEYRRIKGLTLNIQKRLCWHLKIEEGSSRCLLISIKARTANEDLIYDDRAAFFNHYCKFIFPSADGIKKFITIPLVNLNF